MIRTTPAAPGAIAWIDLHTRDLSRARAFYGALLGWTFTGGDNPDIGFYGMAQHGGRDVAGISVLPPQAPFAPKWNVFFATQDVDATAVQVKAAGGEVLFGPLDVLDAGRMASFRDPTGAPVNAWQARKNIGLQKFGETGAPCWFETYSTDAARARDFYARVFGLSVHPLGGGFDYATLQRGEEIVCGTMQMPTHFPAGTPSHWNVYFAVDDADAAVAKVQALGGTVVSPAFDSPYGRLAFVRDPDGVAFNVMKPSR